MPDYAVLAEIARLEGLIGQLQRDLEALRRRVEGPPRSKTRAFTAPPPPVESQPTVPAMAPPMSPESMPESVPAPAPSTGVISQTIASETRRRAPSSSVGLSAPPPPPQAHTTPSRRAAVTPPEAGRYGFVGEGRKRR